MDERDILHHLLEVENNAAALVSDAQAEADRRVADGEKQGRSDYDSRYGARVSTLDVEFADECAKMDAEYKADLGSYKIELDSLVTDFAAFSALAEKFLFREH